MGLFEAKGQLDRGMKDLLIRWNLARSQWKDNVADATSSLSPMLPAGTPAGPASTSRRNTERRVS